MSRSNDLATRHTLAATDIASGTFADARISSSSVAQHATTYDDSKVRSDIAINALRYGLTENQNAYNTTDSFIDNFNDSSGIATFTNTSRSIGGEFINTDAAVSATAEQIWNTISGWGDNEFIENAGVSGTANSFNWTTSKTSGITGLNDEDNNNKSVYINGFHVSGGTIWNDGANFIIDFQTDLQELDYILIKLVDSSNAKLNEVSVYTSSEDSDIAATNLVFTQQNIREGSSGEFVQKLALSNTTGQKTISLETPAKFRYLKFRIHSIQEAGDGNPEIAHFVTHTKAISSTNATGHIISNASTPSSDRTKVSGIMLYKNNNGTATLGTDLKVQFTCIAGDSNWVNVPSYTEATPEFSTGIKMVKLGEATCNTGSNIRYKVLWTDQSSGSKEYQLHGIALNY